MTQPYVAAHPSQSRFLPIRGLNYHLLFWDGSEPADSKALPLVLLHGWMDVAASFQFMVDALTEADGPARRIFAPDWRGFGLTEARGADTFWLPDYLGDLDALLDALVPQGQVDLLGHSMGGNVAMIYAGTRPERIRRLVNLEGFGLPATEPSQAPARLVKWLDELKTPMSLRSYGSLDEVAERLSKNNPLLSADKAAWLAPHWSAKRDDGRFHILGDPAHKRANPVLYRRDEVLESWKRITAPVLWAEGDRTDIAKWWGDRYPRSDFEARLQCVSTLERVKLSPCGHMLHHDQPQALAEHLHRFLG